MEPESNRFEFSGETSLFIEPAGQTDSFLFQKDLRQ